MDELNVVEIFHNADMVTKARMVLAGQIPMQAEGSCMCRWCKASDLEREMALAVAREDMECEQSA